MASQITGFASSNGLESGVGWESVRVELYFHMRRREVQVAAQLHPSIHVIIVDGSVGSWVDF